MNIEDHMRNVPTVHLRAELQRRDMGNVGRLAADFIAKLDTLEAAYRALLNAENPTAYKMKVNWKPLTDMRDTAHNMRREARQFPASPVPEPGEGDAATTSGEQEAGPRP